MLKQDYLSLRISQSFRHISVITIVHFLLHLRVPFLDLQPNTFFDEAMFSHNVFGMLWNNTWQLPPNLLTGGFVYYVCFLPNKLIETFFGSLSLQESEIISRIVLISVSLLMPIYVYKVFKLLAFHPIISLLGATLATASPFTLAYSRTVYPDHFIPALMSLLVFYLVKHSKKDGGRGLLYLGAAAGVIISTKYSGLLILPALGLSLFVSKMHDGYSLSKSIVKSARSFVTMLSITTIVFCLITNTAILAGDVPFAINDAVTRYTAGQMGAISNNVPFFYAKVLLFQPVGFSTGLFIILGLYYLIQKREFVLLMFAVALVVTFFAVNARYNMAFPRNATLLAPVVFIFCGAALQMLAEKINDAQREKKFGSLISSGIPKHYFIVVLLFAEPIARSGIQIFDDYEIDSRLAANNWLQRNICPGRHLGYIHRAWGGPYNDSQSIKSVILPLGSPKESLQNVDYYIFDSWQVDINEAGHSMLEWRPYSEHHFVNTVHHKMPLVVQQHRDFISDFELVKSFDEGKYHGPSVYIYKKKHDSTGRTIKGHNSFQLFDFAAGGPSEIYLAKKGRGEGTVWKSLEWNLPSGAQYAFLEKRYPIEDVAGKRVSFCFHARTDQKKANFSSHGYVVPNAVLDNTAEMLLPDTQSPALTEDWTVVKGTLTFPSSETRNSHGYASVRLLFIEDTQPVSAFIRNLSISVLD